MMEEKLIYDDLKKVSPKMHSAAQRLQVSALLILQSCLGLPICLKVNCLHTYEMGISVWVPTLFI